MIAVLPLLVLLGLMAGIGVLLAHHKTRIVTAILLGAMLVISIPAVLVLLLSFRHGASTHARAEAESQHARAMAEAEMARAMAQAERARAHDQAGRLEHPPLPSFPAENAEMAWPPRAPGRYHGEEHPSASQVVAWVNVFTTMVIGVVVVGAVMFVIALAVNPRTRPVGLTILSLGLVLLVMAAAMFWVAVPQRSSVPVMVNVTPSAPSMVALQPPADQAFAEAIEGPAAEAPDPENVAMGDPLAAPVNVPSAAPVQSKKLFEAIARAVGQAVADNKSEPAAESPAAAPSDKPKPLVVSSAKPAVFKRAQRPSWLSDRSVRDGDVTYRVVTLGPYTTREECDAKLVPELDNALAEYIDACLGPQALGRVHLASYDLRQMIDQQFEERVTSSVGPMVQLHLRLKFDVGLRKRIEEAWQRVLVIKRLFYAGAGLAGVLGMLTLVFGYLKIDQATKGNYRGRLRLTVGVMVAAVAIVVVAMLS